MWFPKNHRNGVFVDFNPKRTYCYWVTGEFKYWNSIPFGFSGYLKDCYSRKNCKRLAPCSTAGCSDVCKNKKQQEKQENHHMGDCRNGDEQAHMMGWIGNKNEVIILITISFHRRSITSHHIASLGSWDLIVYVDTRWRWR